MELRVILSVTLCLLLAHCGNPSPTVIVESEPSVESFIHASLNGGGAYRDIPFSEVIHASTGKRIIPLDPNEEGDALILDEISRALSIAVNDFNSADSPTNHETRVQDLATLFEDRIRVALDRAPGFRCGPARTRSGHLTRSGYPDLRLVFENTGRVVYLVPKLVEQGCFQKSLQSFYYAPKGRDGKVLEDAHHLLAGIEHDGNTGRWRFQNWRLVDLSRFRVQLKAEFQAGNRDLYRPELVIRNGTANAPPIPGGPPSDR